MKNTTFIIFLLFFTNLFCQEELAKIDSLKNEIWVLEQRFNTLEILMIARSGVQTDSSLISTDEGRLPAMERNELITYSSDSPNQGNIINDSFWLSVAILGFGILIIAGALFIMIRQKKGWGPNAIQIVGIVLIVISTLFLITAGYSESQITPAIGLLGTIAGYLLGKTNKE